MDADARSRLIERARRELPAPGDPRVLADDLLEAGLTGREALEVLARAQLAWVQLRDLSLERAWQSGYGWFLARNLMLLGVLALVVTVTLRPALVLLEAALVGAGAYYLLVQALAPLRLRRHRRRRATILDAYGRDLSAFLDELEGR